MNSFGDMWVFGKDYEGNELYIKIALGRNENLTTRSNENSRRMPGEKIKQRDVLLRFSAF